MTNSRFNWVPFYQEAAQKLLPYMQNRAELLSWVYSEESSKFTGYLHEEDGSPLADIDPFTVLGIFNRGISDENRRIVARHLKEFLGIKAEVPQDFAGIPILNNLRSWFFGYAGVRKSDDIDNLWELFVQALSAKGAAIASIFDKVKEQFAVNINVTMGLYWVAPDRFIALDRRNREYLHRKYGLDIGGELPEYEKYARVVSDIQERMRKGVISERSFPEISYNAWMGNQEENVVTDKDWRDEVTDLWRYKKNIVLQGAPGTGKTYEVPELIVRLCRSLPQKSGKSADRKTVMAAYEQLVKEGRVAFTTFHQSMDYEDFVEGLKPEVTEGSVCYSVVDGLFKQLCAKAQMPSAEYVDLGIRPNPTIWKVSLMATYDNPIRTDCLENDRIRIGWDEYGPHISEDMDFRDGGSRVLDAYINQMQVGDIVMSCYSNRLIDAIGVVTGDYIWDSSLPKLKRVRPVRWLIRNIKEDIYEMNSQKLMTLSTVYRLYIPLDNVFKLLEKHGCLPRLKTQCEDLPYVLVIDEINRGNASKIFGELITLLEPDKRIGEESELKVLLPYSKEGFRVPSNVYLIATMNTADRSLGSMDYAVRRRFAFVPMSPCSLQGEVEGFDEPLFRKVSELFVENYEDVMSDYRVRPIPAACLSAEYDPADVWIGQSYFLMRDRDGTDRAYYRLHYEVIPILREYLRDGVFRDRDKVECCIADLETWQND